MEKIYDLIIIGSGPAGLSAAVYAARAALDFIVIEENAISGGQVLTTYDVDNYLGFPNINGFDLADNMRKHAEKLGAQFVTDTVTKIEPGTVKILHTFSGKVYRSKTLIMATGAMSRRLDVPGEERLKGMGVSYCATCDGNFFRGRTVAVVGGGDVAVEDAIYLARICRKVIVIHRRDEFRAAKSLCDSLKQCENVEIMWNTTVQEIQGEDCVERLRICNTVSREESELEADGVFIAVGTKPNSEILKGIVDMAENGEIIAGENCATTSEGIFAAGDVRKKTLRQIVTAVADGANAVNSAIAYI